jgi:hypothetical protein
MSQKPLSLRVKRSGDLTIPEKSMLIFKRFRVKRGMSGF